MGGVCSSRPSVVLSRPKAHSVDNSALSRTEAAQYVEGTLPSAGYLLAHAEEPKQAPMWVLRKTPIVNTIYKFHEKIGIGQFGVVYRVQDMTSGHIFACKSIAKKKLLCEMDATDVRREIQVMYHLRGHPCTVCLNEVLEDKKYVHFVMDICAGGDLHEALVTATGSHFDEEQAACVIRAALQAVQHCHSMGVLHRDIKPENFLLPVESEPTTLKLSDYGLSVFFQEGQTFRDLLGSTFYMAPEVVRRHYSKEADVWACGITLYALLCGVPPFFSDVDKEVFSAILSSTLDFSFGPWPKISRGAKEVVRRMLVKDPVERATIDEILMHPWIVGGGQSGAGGRVPSHVARRRGRCYAAAYDPHAADCGAVPKPAGQHGGPAGLVPRRASRSAVSTGGNNSDTADAAAAAAAEEGEDDSSGGGGPHSGKSGPLSKLSSTVASQSGKLQNWASGLFGVVPPPPLKIPTFTPAAAAITPAKNVAVIRVLPKTPTGSITAKDSNNSSGGNPLSSPGPAPSPSKSALKASIEALSATGVSQSLPELSAASAGGNGVVRNPLDQSPHPPGSVGDRSFHTTSSGVRRGGSLANGASSPDLFLGPGNIGVGFKGGVGSLGVGGYHPHHPGGRSARDSVRSSVDGGAYHGENVLLERLQTFAQYPRVRKEALRALACGLSDEYVAGLRSLFQDFDRDQDKMISDLELANGFMRKGLDVAPCELKYVLEGVDINGSGSIEMDEWLAATVDMPDLNKPGVMMRKAFAYFDSNNDGFITIEELRLVLEPQLPGQAMSRVAAAIAVAIAAADPCINMATRAAEALRFADANGDGRISFDEFFAVMTGTAAAAAAMEAADATVAVPVPVVLTPSSDGRASWGGGHPHPIIPCLSPTSAAAAAAGLRRISGVNEVGEYGMRVGAG